MPLWQSSFWQTDEFRANVGAARILRNWSIPRSVFLFIVITLLIALGWAKARDPFRRIEFSIKTESDGRVKGAAVLPKSSGRRFRLARNTMESFRSLESATNRTRQLLRGAWSVFSVKESLSCLEDLHTRAP